MNQYAKAIVAAVLAGGTAFESSGGSSGHALIAALVAAAVTGLTVWGVPNSVASEVKPIVAAIQHPSPDSDATQVMPIIRTGGNA